MANVREGWTQNRASPAAAAPHGNAPVALFGLFVVSAWLYATTAFVFGLEPQVPLVALAVLAIAYLLAICGLGSHPHPRFGYANMVTATRAALACLAGAIVLCADAFARSGSLLALLIVLAAVALALDGVDGHLARRFDQASEFGARFDMETDAFLILVLSLAALMLGKAGAWILAIGLMRYAFIAGQRLMPRLNAPLLPSFRRKAVCVLQVVALLGLLLPIVASPISDAIAIFALVALACSFGADCVYLLRRQPDLG